MADEGRPEPSQVLLDRRRKLEELRAAGVEPFPHAFPGVRPIADVKAPCADLPDGEETDASARIAGRLAARRAANESAAIGNLRTIGSAEATYFSQRGRYGSFANLTNMSMLDTAMVNNATRDSYRLTELGTTGPAFEFTATPTSASSGMA